MAMASRVILSAVMRRQATSVVSRIIPTRAMSMGVVGGAKRPDESWDEFDKRFVQYFADPQLDNWWLRKRLQELHCEDCIPDPKVASEALKACRRLNDIGIAIRFLETMRFKCGPKVSSIWPYMMQELKPTLDELGIPTLETLGYDKPEFACEEVHDIH